MTNHIPSLAANIRARRKKAHLSQDALSKLAGFTLHTLTKIEIGATTDPRVSTVKRLADALHTNVDALVK